MSAFGFLYALIIPYLAALLAHLAGLVAAIILLIRSRTTPALLSVVGFAVLAMFDVFQFVLGMPPVFEVWAPSAMAWLWIINCCCSVFNVAAIACIIVAIWQAISGAGVGGMMAEPWGVPDFLAGTSEEPESAAEVPEDAPEEDPLATRILEETLRGTPPPSEEASEGSE
jgi:hypothetical protein